ncbi:restriction endonuclease subunit S [Brachyspira intermedia]|uniref:restriction endonuclease subunit S n=2 Tax=Brachyspira intermedia TaxID=84377 RepID=UPI003005C46A
MKNTHLPTGWQEFKLKDILANEKYSMKRGPFGSSLKKEFFVKEGIKVFEQYNPINNDPYWCRYRITKEKYSELSAFKCKAGDFLVSCSGTLGKIILLPDDVEEGIINQALLKIRLNNDIIDNKYFLNLFQSKIFQDKIYSDARGGAIQNVASIDEIKLIHFILPPLDEQKRIAEVLSLCDDIIENLTELIDKKEQYKKGVMQRVLSGEVRFKGFTDEWQTVRLGDILSYEQPNNYIVKNDEYNNKYECPVLTAGKTFVLGYTNEKFGIYNEIPVIIFDDFTTETKYVNFPFKVKSSAIKILSSNKCNLKLIYELIKMIKFNAESHKRYWISEYQYLEIKIPKSIEEQKKIAGLLSLIDEDIENLKKQLELRKQQKKGLMQRLLTGEVRI